MECLNTSRGLAGYVDGLSSPAEKQAIERHLSCCPSCEQRVADYRQLRSALGELPKRAPSAHLQMRLRVLASKDQARRLAHQSYQQKWHIWRDKALLTINNVTRPLMVPVAGGFASACLLFGLLVPDFAHEVHPVRNDVPTPVLFTQASVDYLMPISISDSEIELDVNVDDAGKMVDYHVIKGQNLLRDDMTRRRLESSLLIQKFVPATTFGQPTAGHLRVRVLRDEVDVKG